MRESAINPNINEEFPYSGIDNPIQGLRDNFSIIKTSLTVAKSEITYLLNQTTRIDSKDINFNGRALTNTVFKNSSDYRYDVIGVQTTDFDIDYVNGVYQTAQIGADLTINLKNFPIDTDTMNNIGFLKLHLFADTVTRKVRFTTADANIRYNNEMRLVEIDKFRIPGSPIKNPIILEIWKDNGPYQPTVYIKSEGFYRIHEPPPAPPLSYVDNIAPLTSIASIAFSSNDQKPGINIGAGITSEVLLYVDGNLKSAVYNSLSGSLTPVDNLPDGIHEFSYAIIDRYGYPGTTSDFISINIDTAAPAAGLIALRSDTGSNISDFITKNGQITVSGLEVDSTWEYSINSGNTWISGNGSSFSIPAGTYTTGALKVRQTDTAGNLQTTNIPTISNTIIVDITPPTTGHVELGTDTGSSASDGITNNGRMNVSSLESGSTWEYSTDSGNIWSTGIGTYFTLLPGTYAIGSIQIRQTDVAGNLQITNTASNSNIITVDVTTPNTGSLVLAVDDGASSSDGNSSNGAINVSGLESDTTWEYSIDSGSTWTAGSGSTFTLANGTYNAGTIKVRQTDRAGNVQTLNMASNPSTYVIAPYVPPVPVIPGIPASNAAWGGAGNGGTANYRGGYSACSSHNGNGGGGSASPLGGDGANWMAIAQTEGTHGTGGSGGGYDTAGVAGTGTLSGYNQSVTDATGIGNGGGSVETDGINNSLTQTRVGHGTGGLIRITINTGSYSFTPADLIVFSGTRLAAANKAIEWDNSSAIKTSSDPYDHSLIGEFIVPAGVTKIDIGVIGGGGGGAIGPCVNAGGGGGGAALRSGYTVVPGTVYKIKVGAGGQGGYQGSSRGSAQWPPYGVSEAPWRGGTTAFCSSTGTEIVWATGGNTRPDSCAGFTNADSATADTADVPGPNVAP